MSSIVNKSGVRFTPKVKQRRSITHAHTPRRKSNVVPVSIEPSVEPDSKQHTQEDGDDRQSIYSDADEPTSSPVRDSTIVIPTPSATQRDSISHTLNASRRGSIIETTPNATKHRRLSTLSNTARDIFRKTSFSGTAVPEVRTHVISIPQSPQQPPLPLPSKRRRSSVAGPRSISKRRSASVADDQQRASSITPVFHLPTPEPTQDSVHEIVMSKADAKAPEDPHIGETIVEEDEPAEDGIKKSDESKFIPGERLMEGILFDVSQQRFRKVTYDSCDKETEMKIIKDIRTVSKYSQLSKSLHSLDPDELAKITIDDESFTMEDLCKPTLPIGRVSSQFEKVQEAKKNRMEARKKRQELRRRAKEQKVSLESLEKVEVLEKKVKPEDLFDEALKEQDEGQQHSAIQLKIGTDGTLVVDEESRIVDRHKNMDNIVRERFDENPFENIVNSATYGRQRYSDKWDKDEITKFYKALGQWGTDFALIAQMFPHRTRRQIKSKFILEEKKRPALIELALANKLKVEFDFDEYCKDANKTFGTLEQFGAKIDQLKVDHEENLKELSIAKVKAKEEDLQKQKKKEYEIQTGQRTMTRQERITELTKHETVLGSIDDVKKQRQLEEEKQRRLEEQKEAAVAASEAAAA